MASRVSSSVLVALSERRFYGLFVFAWYRDQLRHCSVDTVPEHRVLFAHLKHFFYASGIAFVQLFHLAQKLALCA